MIISDHETNLRLFIVQVSRFAALLHREYFTPYVCQLPRSIDEQALALKFQFVPIRFTSIRLSVCLEPEERNRQVSSTILSAHMAHTCPVCGFAQLDDPAYD